jgi:hypothetical protein
MGRRRLMLIGSNLNPYKKLLEAKSNTYYKSLINALLKFFEDEAVLLEEETRSDQYVKNKYTSDISLESMFFEYEELDYSDFILKYKNLLSPNAIADIKRIGNTFILKNFNYRNDGFDLPLQNELCIIFDNMNKDDYFILGSIGVGFEDILKNYDSNTKIKIGSKKKSLFSVIKEFPDTDIFEKLLNEEYSYNMGNWVDLIDTLITFKEELDNTTEDDYSEQGLYVLFESVDDEKTKSYNVGLKKEIFYKNFFEYLKEEGFVGIKSDDNSVWEEE